MKKLMTMTLMMAMVLFFSCNKDEEKVLSPAEAKVELTQLSTDVEAKMAEMQQAEGLAVMGMLMQLDPFSTLAKSTGNNEVITTINRYLLPFNPQKESSSLKTGGFDFDGNVGTYTYKTTFPNWTVVPGGNTIVINFPSDEAHMDVNDAKLTINSFDEQYIGSDYYPTDVNAELTVSSIKIVGIDLTATWFTTGEFAEQPKTLDLAVYLYPFDFTVNFDHGSTSVSVDVAINYQNAQFFSAGIGATFANSTWDDAPININGYVQFFDVKLQASVDLKDLETVINNAGTYSDADAFVNAINKEISAAVYVGGAKAADLKLVLNLTAGPDDLPVDIMFVYSDGTSESAIPYFEDLALSLEDFFYSLEDFYGSW